VPDILREPHEISGISASRRTISNAICNVSRFPATAYGTSPRAWENNCIARAASDEAQWWWPDDDAYWPSEDRVATVEGTID